MKAPRLLSALAILLALGCHAKPATEAHWEKTTDTAEPLEVARAACKQQAVEATSGTPNQDLATKQAAGVFAGCMRKRGWTLVEGPAR